MTSPQQGIPPETKAPDDIRPVVRLPRGDLPPALLLAIGIALALALFLFLNGRRLSQEANTDASQPGIVLTELPPLDVPPPPPNAPLTVLMREIPRTPRTELPSAPPASLAKSSPAAVIGDPLMPAPPASSATASRTGGAALIFDISSGNGAASSAGGAADGGPSAAAADGDTARASLIRNRTTLIPQGTMVAAVLETPLNSDRPGMARALVSKDARSFDGSRILIPRGSRLIGEFKADSSPGQRRILITWTRLIRPDGVAIRIGSPSADALGGMGVAGRVNTHFFERFTNAILQSALLIGVNVASQVNSQPNSVYVGLPSQLGQLGQQLSPSTSRPPTVKVREGAEIAIFVARDLDFGGTPAVR